jgi:hypothetical protein
MKITLLVFTDGRLEYLARAIASLKENVLCNFSALRIVNDEPKAAEHLTQTYSPLGFEVVSNPSRIGFCGSIQRAWDSLPEGTEWVFHCEDDFVYNEPIPVMDMIKVLQEHPYLAQMALLRQAVNSEEKAAGGILQAHPGWWTEKQWGWFKWLEYNVCMTTNPSVYPVKVTRYPYGNAGDGEGAISKLLREEGYLYGYWDGLDQTPKVTHIGEHRSQGAFF